MDVIISTMINLEIKVLSVGIDIDTCKSECSKLQGHLPYSFEGKGDFFYD